MLAHAFEVWDVHRASFRTDERNARSRRAIERLGARPEGVRLADTPARDGTVRNSAYYSILRADWPAVRERLTRFLARLEGPRPAPAATRRARSRRKREVGAP